MHLDLYCRAGAGTAHTLAGDAASGFAGLSNNGVHAPMLTHSSSRLSARHSGRFGLLASGGTPKGCDINESGALLPSTQLLWTEACVQTDLTMQDLQRADI